jgi:hypothetical protein
MVLSRQTSDAMRTHDGIRFVLTNARISQRPLRVDRRPLGEWPCIPIRATSGLFICGCEVEGSSTTNSGPAAFSSTGRRATEVRVQK